MKEIRAIIQPHMLSRVREGLEELSHFPGMTVTKCRGLGRGRGQGGSFVQTEDELQYHDRECLSLSVVTNNVPRSSTLSLQRHTPATQATVS
ncbi:MAG: hypothetical protein IPH59_17545 [bacterium]|nr:hypothetical protein [bacterium]